MAIPSEANGGWYACLYDFAGLTVRDFIRGRFNPDSAALLDVGAGWGKYRLLLPEFAVMDAVEIWRPYVEECALEALYRTVYVENVLDFAGRTLRYDAVIFGDTLEHIAPAEAARIVQIFDSRGAVVVAAVPFTMEQEPVDGNPFEKHLQPDLTPELMAARFPSLCLLAQQESKAVYATR